MIPHHIKKQLTKIMLGVQNLVLPVGLVLLEDPRFFLFCVSSFRPLSFRREPLPCQVCTANANADQAPGAKTGANITAAAGPLPVGSMTAPSASVFRQFEVQVRPEPPPPPVAPDGRTAEDTLIGKMGLGGGEGAFLTFVSVLVGTKRHKYANVQQLRELDA